MQYKSGMNVILNCKVTGFRNFVRNGWKIHRECFRNGSAKIMNVRENGIDLCKKDSTGMHFLPQEYFNCIKQK